jgi:alkylation response protein AidB-like acyl-CoA dehydrogenase
MPPPESAPLQLDFGIFRLPDEYLQLRHSVRELTATRIAPRAAAIDETAQFAWDVHAALVQSGFNAPHIPERYGGAGADALATVIVIEEIARGCASSALIPAVNKLGTLPLLEVGSEELRQRYLPPVARGEAMFSYALSEPDAGSDAASMTTRAVRDGDEWVLSGTKRWITGAGESLYYTVFAVTDPKAGAAGISAFVVEKADAGLTFGAAERKLGIKGSPTREMYFDSCRIPGWRLIGAEGSGLKTALRTLDHTRVTIAAQALGLAAGALAAAVEYTSQRRQFGEPVGQFQGVQFMLADMAMKVEAARALTYAAAAKSQAGAEDLSYFGASAKCFASDVAMEVTTDAVQLFGGYGYVKDYPVERMMRDAKITQIYEGTNQVQRIVIARELRRAGA